MLRIERSMILKTFREMIAQGQSIIGAGTELSAKCEASGGIDLIVIDHSGHFRMAGRGSLAGVLAYGNANEIVMDMAHEVLPVVENTSVLAGANGTDSVGNFDHFRVQVRSVGVSGIQNCPRSA